MFSSFSSSTSSTFLARGEGKQAETPEESYTPEQLEKGRPIPARIRHAGILAAERGEAARTVNVAPRTVYRWLKEPEFDAAYRASRRKAYGQSIARLQQASAAAATTLLKVMVDPATPASTRVKAAESVLTHAAKAIEIEDLDARVSELERTTEAARQNQ